MKVAISVATLIAAVCGAYVYYQWDHHFVFPEKRMQFHKFFKDESSLIYKNEKIISRAYCAEVNAKNSYGGYVGFKRVVEIDGGIYVDEYGKMTPDLSTHELIALTEAQTQAIKYSDKVVSEGGKELDQYEIRIMARKIFFNDIWSKNCSLS